MRGSPVHCGGVGTRYSQCFGIPTEHFDGRRDAGATWTSGSGVAFFLPDLPIGAGGFEHLFGGLVQPLWFSFVDVAEDCLAGGWCAKVDVGGFVSHGVEEAKLVIGGAQGGKQDAGAIGGEAADDPAAAELNEVIGTADGAVDDGLVEDFGGAAVPIGFDALSPVRGRRDQRFGFAGDAAAAPVSDGYVAGMAQAAESGDAVGEAVGDAGSWHQMLQGIDGSDRALGFEGAERVHFLPEVDGIAEFAGGDAAQPLMTFS